MTEWIPCETGFITADVIRWREGIWLRRGPKARRAVKIGDRLVVAEVLQEADEEGWVLLLVVSCEIIGEISGVKEGRREWRLKKGSQFKRKVGSIKRGRPERLAWSEEGVRAKLVRKFRGKKEKPISRFMSMDMDDED